MSNLAKYLTKYAEKEVEYLAGFPLTHHYQHVVLIPAYKEQQQFVNNFIQSELAQQNVLVIIVVNQPANDLDLSPQISLYSDIQSKGNTLWQSHSLCLVSLDGSNSACLLVDRFNEPIPRDEGVGLARKIAADLACKLKSLNVVKSAWLHSSDADAHLPNNYFSALTGKLKNDSSLDKKLLAVAACYNFLHYSEDKNIHEANAIYEQSLRYYVSGLDYAGSPYNFFTIGSILAFTIEAYATVRGFPKRSAGEDFYLLNKIAKLGDVLWLKHAQLTLEARTSNRVPFGTGPAVVGIMDLNERQELYYYYHPEVFEKLKHLNGAFKQLVMNDTPVEEWVVNLGSEISEALQAIGFNSFIAKQNRANTKQLSKQINVWFDAFKTLKFIHYLRDNYYPNIDLGSAVEVAEKKWTRSVDKFSPHPKNRYSV